jgi:putative SOS response-associated peptidase YedK
MCGRYFLHADADELQAVFGAMPMPRLAPRYNIAPTQPVPIVRESATGGRETVLVRWGLVPGWSKGPDSRYSMINARAETVAEKPAYRSALRYRRCLVPANGFYEWRAGAAGKQPMAIRPAAGGLLALAGLWEHWQDADGNELESCTILVRPADGQVKPVHDRMPLIVGPESFAVWLDRRAQNPAAIGTLIAALQPPRLLLHPVSRRVNSPAHDGAELIEPVEDSEAADG